MTMPVVSVLMTAFNREKYIAEAIESVLASTFKDFELVIVDDGSKDRTVEIARRYLADPRVQLHLNEKNLGDYPNRNHAASLARGKYLKYIDADDMVYTHGLEVMVQMMEQFPDAGLGLASLEQDRARIYPFQLSPREAYRRHYFEQPLFDKAPLSAMIRADAFKSVGGFTGKRYVGDFEMWHILAARYPVVLMPQGVVWYRVHPEQEMQHNRNSKLIPFKYLSIACEQLLSPDCPLLPSDKEHAVCSTKRIQARKILRTVIGGDHHSAHEMFKQSGFSLPTLLSAAFARLNANPQ
jgi:glycosyltransferase involved in cell wall biosynthesis